MTPYYEESGIAIYHGDCRDVLPTLPRVDLVLTDPPYGIGFAARPTKWQRLAGQAAEAWDDCRIDCMEQILTAGAAQVIWGGNYYALPPSRGWLCWYKPDAPPSMGNFELGWTNQDCNSRLVTCSISSANGERAGHPTQKPLAVMLWALKLFPAVRSVIDPFLGSGTTLVAAKRLGLRAVGIEIEKRYCDMAIERLKQREMLPFDEPAPEWVQDSLL